MPIIPQKLRRENRIRDYINQFLMNIGQNNGEDWWDNPQASKALAHLADAAQLQVTDSSELCIDCEDALVVGVWNGGTNALALDQLMGDIQKQTEKIAKEKTGGISQKMTIQFLLFTSDLKSRTALEIKLDKDRKRILSGIATKIIGAEAVCQYTFVIDREYLGDAVRIGEIKLFDSILMSFISGRPNTDVRENTAKSFPQSIVLTVPLRQMVALYNQVGDQLFKRNVRLGITDKMDVHRAMCQTLEKEPEYFWYMNNGITLLVDDPDFRFCSADSLELGSLEPDSTPMFSVINGAQTISICSKYAFEWEYRKENVPRDRKEAEKRLENFEKAQVILRVIHIPLRMDQASSVEEQKNIRLADNISISLNRQKPVKQEDIAFTTPFVQKMLEYLESRAGVPFYLVRRGENRGYVIQMDLVTFSKARLACANQPGQARNVSNGKIMGLELDGDSFRRKDIFVEEWLADDIEQDAVFGQFYGAVLFASQLENCYKRNQKMVQKKMKEEGCGEDALSALNNGSWYFTALLIQLLNGFSIDYSKFDCKVSDIADKVPAAMEVFANMTACCAKEKRMLNSNDFKKELLYKIILSELKDAEKTGFFQKFRELFGEFIKNRPEIAAESIQIAYGPVFNQENPKSVNTAADAFVQTVRDILYRFAPDSAMLEDFSAWLTTDEEKYLTSHNYIKEPPSVVYNGKTYWIGTSISNHSKYVYLNRLCKVSGVPKGEITWEKGDNTLYKW